MRKNQNSLYLILLNRKSDNFSYLHQKALRKVDGNNFHLLSEDVELCLYYGLLSIRLEYSSLYNSLAAYFLLLGIRINAVLLHFPSQLGSKFRLLLLRQPLNCFQLRKYHFDRIFFLFLEELRTHCTQLNKMLRKIQHEFDILSI